MGDEIVGRPVNAVLAPPQAERFAAVADVDPNRLVLNVTGCNKLVLLDSDRVFLFPRSATGVEWFERELAAYQALDPAASAATAAEAADLLGRPGLRRRRRDFSARRARGWRAYAQARGLDVGSRPLETAFRLRHALRLLADPGDPAVDGTIEEHLAQL